MAEAAPGIPPILEARNLSLAFGKIQALSSVSLSIGEGEILSVIGPNGAGKSSLLNCLSDFYRPDAGRILYFGNDITSMPAYRRAAAGIARTFQGIQTYASMTVRENILTGFHVTMKTGLLDAFLYWPRVRGEERRFAQRAEEIIEFLELEELRHVRVGELGYGIRKRVDLGRALALDPKVLIMDEPMAGMNTEEKGDLARFVLDIKDARRIPIVLVEHDMEVVMDISDRVMVMEWGVTIVADTPDNVRMDPRVIAAYLGEEEKDEDDRRPTR
jgi:branched-chain amino acid transport system ATP-binding protein